MKVKYCLLDDTKSLTLDDLEGQYCNRNCYRLEHVFPSDTGFLVKNRPKHKSAESLKA